MEESLGYGGELVPSSQQHAQPHTHTHIHMLVSDAEMTHTQVKQGHS